MLCDLQIVWGGVKKKNMYSEAKQCQWTLFTTWSRASGAEPLVGKKKRAKPLSRLDDTGNKLPERFC